MALGLATQQPGDLLIQQTALSICHEPGTILGATDTQCPMSRNPSLVGLAFQGNIIWPPGPVLTTTLKRTDSILYFIVINLHEPV